MRDKKEQFLKANLGCLTSFYRNARVHIKHVTGFHFKMIGKMHEIFCMQFNKQSIKN